MLVLRGRREVEHARLSRIIRRIAVADGLGDHTREDRLAMKNLETALREKYKDVELVQDEIIEMCLEDGITDQTIIQDEERNWAVIEDELMHALNTVVAFNTRCDDLDPANAVRVAKKSYVPFRQSKIKPFDPKTDDYQQFLSVWNMQIGQRGDLTDDAKLYELTQHVTGTAALAIKKFAIKEENYTPAMATLEERFGRKQDLIQKYLTAFREVTSVTRMDGEALEALFDSLNSTYQNLLALGVTMEPVQTIPMMEAKFPAYIRREFEKQKRTHLHWEVDEFLEFLADQISVQRAVELSEPKGASKSSTATTAAAQGSQAPAGGGGQQQVKATTAAAPASDSKGGKKGKGAHPKGGAQGKKDTGPKWECYLCKTDDHSLEDCDDFKKLSFAKRIKFVKDSGGCFWCLKRGHMSSACKIGKPCPECGRKHHTLLHRSSGEKTEETPTVAAAAKAKED